VRQEIGLPVGIINPAVDRPVPPKLGEVASSVRHISLKDLRESQFPATVPKAGGKPIDRPPSWA